MIPITVAGAGPAGLMAAEVLAQAGHRVTIIDHMAAPARKFLLAGRGGLNLTHSEPLEQLLGRYGEARSRLEPAIRAFPPEALIAWANGLGVETFVGTSGRVFPKAMKASPLLRAWLRRLDSLGVELRTRTEWPGFDGTPTILAFGGASWPHLGSNASWLPLFEAAGIRVNPFKPANSRFLVNWSPIFRDRFAGTPVKNVALTYAGHRVRGEVMIS
ncbi:MAG: NAD(P)/FAD-dependent oxidoreductase, partial [Aestuariivirga sp.]